MIERLGRLPLSKQRALLIAAGLLLFAVWLCRVPLTEVDEVRYTEATRQMVASGNYLIPYFNGEPRYQKPILYYWVQSLSVRALGVNEFAARLPSALIAILLLLTVHAALLRWLAPAGKETDDRSRAAARGSAFIGAALLMSMPLVAIWARAATTDITLTFFMTLALLALLQAEVTRARSWYLAAAVACGLAFLTKGPVGLILPGAAWLLFHLRGRTLATEARRVPWAAATLLFLAVALPWYAATWVHDGPDFIRHFFLVENVGRFTTTQEGHGAGNRLLGLLIYLPVVLLALYPATPFLARDLLAPPAGDSATFGLRRYAWCWLAAVIGVFAFSKTQLPSYIQSAAPAAAILFALHLYGRLARGRANSPLRGQTIERLLLWLPGGLYIAAGLLALLVLPVSGPLGPAPVPRGAALIVASALTLAGCFFFAWTWASARRGDEGTFVAGVTGGWGVVMLVLLLGAAPLLISASYAESRDVGAYLRSCPASLPIVAVHQPFSENLVYYSRRVIARYPTAKVALPALQDAPALVVTDAAEEARFAEAGFTTMRRFRHAIVMRHDTTVPEGRQ